jgi:hypothetical protein
VRIYSNKLTKAKVLRAFAAAREIIGADIWAVDARSFTPRNGRHNRNGLYRYGIEVFAESRHGTAATGHAPIASGPRDHLPRAASWSDYGWVIAYLYAEDPHAKIGFYGNRDDFIAQVEASHRREPKDFLALVRDVPAVAKAYFAARRPVGERPGIGPLDPVSDHPGISSTFTPRAGWVSVRPHVPVSSAWLAVLRARGVTDVTLSAGNRYADFTMNELLPGQA